MLNSCGTDKAGTPNPETMVTQEVDSLFVTESKNGMKSYRFKAPKRIGYDLAREPYEIYPKGVFVETFRDSTEEIESSLTADYAINHKSKSRSLWEAIGNVVATGEDGRTLYTEQLFWDDQTERIYSNVDCKIVQKDGIYIGDGIESDQALKYWKFRNTVSKLEIDPPSGEQSPSQGSRLPEAGETVTEEFGHPVVSEPGSMSEPAQRKTDQSNEPGQREEPGRTPDRNATGRSAAGLNTTGRSQPRPTIQPVENDESKPGAGRPASPTGRTPGRREHTRQDRDGSTTTETTQQKSLGQQ